MLTLDGPRANRVPDSLPAAGKASLLLLERRTSAEDDEGGAFFGNRRRQFSRLFGNHGRPTSTFLTAVQNDSAIFHNFISLIFLPRLKLVARLQRKTGPCYWALRF